MNKTKKNIYNFLERNKVYLDEDIYSYGYDISAKYLLFLIFVVPISIFNNKLIELLFFLFTFVLLRQYLGGLHFKNDSICYLFSIMITIFIPFLANYISRISITIRIFITIITFFIIYYIGVIDNENKKLDISEKKHLKNKAYIVLIMFSIFIFLIYDFDYRHINIMILTILLMDINVLISYLKSYL